MLKLTTDKHEARAACLRQLSFLFHHMVTVIQKSKPFDDNFGKCRQLFKIISPGDS